MKKRTRKKLVALLTILALLLLPFTPITTRTAAAAERHGRDRSRRVNSPDNTVPAGYDVNPATQGKAKNGEYSRFFLKDDLQEVRINISGDNLDYVLQHASEEAMALAESVTIGGVTVENVGFRTKGNYTRTETNNTDSDRFSFTVNFGKYVKKKDGYSATQNFFGCKKISFNNFYFDKTMLKEYSVFKLFNEMGIPSSQYGLARLYINDEFYGVYFMVETIAETIIENYLKSSNTTEFIMKPTGTSLRFKDGDLKECIGDTGEITWDSLVDNGYIVQNADGTYSAKNTLKNYSALWESDNDNFNDNIDVIPKAMTWLNRLTQLSNGKDFDGNRIDVNSNYYLELLDQVINTDECLRYFATHSFVIQMDNMFTWRQNYALYIGDDARSMLVPWDYDLSWGYEQNPADGESSANWSIDKMYNTIAQQGGHYYSDKDYAKFYAGESPYTSNDGYPMFNVIYQNDYLREKFHTYISDCAKIATLGGKTSWGEEFEPRREGNQIDAIYDKLVAAASEPLGKNIYYLQYTQPDAVIKGTQALKQMVALRSVGAWIQATGIDAYVTGYGYLTGSLGDDVSSATYSTGGEDIVVVDDTTGIFTIADYEGTKKSESSSSDPWGGGGWGGWNPGGGWPGGEGWNPGGGNNLGGGGNTGNEIGPELEGTVLNNYSAVKTSIQTLVNAIGDGRNNITVYKMENTKDALSGYKIYVPVPSADSVIYLYDEDANTLTKLAKEQVYDEHTAEVSADDFTYIVVADSDGSTPIVNPGGDPTPTPKPTATPGANATATPGANATATPETNATAAPDTDPTAAPGGNDVPSPSADPGTDATATPAGQRQTNNNTGTPVPTASSDQGKSVKDSTETSGDNSDDIIEPTDVTIKKLKRVKAGTIKITWKKASGNSGYQVKFSLNKNFKGSKIKKVVGASTISVKISGLKNKKLYYVRVRSYIKSGFGVYYGNWSAAKKIRI